VIPRLIGEDSKKEGAMKKIALLITVLYVFSFVITPIAFSQKDEFEEIKQAQYNIKIINLLNSIDLTEDQMRYVLTKAKEVQRIRQESEALLARHKDDMLDTYKQIEDEFQEGKIAVEKDLSKKFRQEKEELEKVVKEAFNKVDEFAQGIESQLEEYQIIALKEYVPCIIPPEGSGRIGQSASATHFIKILERMRHIPQEYYYWKKEEMVDRAVGKADKKSPPGVRLDKERLRIDISDMFDKVRSLRDTDFQLQKSELAKELKEIIKQKPGEKKEVDVVNRIKQFLLVENIISILEERLKISY